MSSPGSHRGGDGGNDSEQSVIKIDPDGDLTLVVGKTKTRFLFCSKSLSRSAPFWKCCLYGPFKEAKPAAGQEWVVELPEDNPHGLRVLLLLVHGMSHKMSRIDLQLAFEVTVLTNKYDMTQYLWPVAGSWLKDLKPPKLNDGYDETIVPQLQWLWVTTELGASDQHGETLAKLSQIVTLSTDEDAQLLLRRYEVGEVDAPISETDVLTKNTLEGYDAEKDVMLLFADSIKAAREIALHKIQSVLDVDVKKLRNDVERFEASSGPCHAYLCNGRTSDGSMLCFDKRSMCEYVMQALVGKVSDWVHSPLEPIAEINMSVENFLSRAHGFVHTVRQETGALLGLMHEDCTPFTTKLPSLNSLKRKTVCVWYEENFDAFKAQARRSGLEKTDGEHGDEDQQILGPRTTSRNRLHNVLEASGR